MRSSLIGAQLMDFTMNGRSPFRRENPDSIIASHNCYRCQGDDKWVSIAVATDEEWNAMYIAMGTPIGVETRPFSAFGGRWTNRVQLDNHISGWTRNSTHRRLRAPENTMKKYLAAYLEWLKMRLENSGKTRLFTDAAFVIGSFCGFRN